MLICRHCVLFSEIPAFVFYCKCGFIIAYILLLFILVNCFMFIPVTQGDVYRAETEEIPKIFCKNSVIMVVDPLLNL